MKGFGKPTWPAPYSAMHLSSCSPLFSAMTGFVFAQEQDCLWFDAIDGADLGYAGTGGSCGALRPGAPLIAVALGVAGAMPIFRWRSRWCLFWEKPPIIVAGTIFWSTWSQSTPGPRWCGKGMRFRWWTPGCLFSRLFLNLYVCWSLGVIRVFAPGKHAQAGIACLLFLVPIYFALIMSNTTHPFLLAFALGCFRVRFFINGLGMGFGDCGTIAGTIAFYSGTNPFC